MSLPDFTVYSQLPTGAYMKKSDRSGPYAWDGSAMILTGFLDSSDNGEAAALTVSTGFVASAGAKFSIFNTVDKVTNYEKGEIAWAANVLTFGTKKGGTGTARALAFLTDNTERARFNAAGGFAIANGNAFDLFNTADQTTNYERLRADWSANVARLFVQSAGTGIDRDFRVGTSTLYHVYQQRTNASPFAAFTLSSATSSTNASGIHQLLSGSLNAASGVQTPVSIAPTINQSGTAGYTALDINPTETATGSGTKLLQRWAVGGTAVSYVSNTGVFAVTGLTSSGAIGFGASIGLTDVTLVRDAADTLALRRSTNAQTFRVYNTYTDASNYEHGGLIWTSNVLYLAAQAAGTGTARPLIVKYTPQTVAALPAAGTVGNGATAYVTDATVTTYASIVAGGGANAVPVYSDGTNWRIG